jgi:hypothetical protein
MNRDESDAVRVRMNFRKDENVPGLPELRERQEKRGDPGGSPLST